MSCSPRIRLRMRRACEYGARRRAITWRGNHVRYVMQEMGLRVTADYSITASLEETPAVLREPVSVGLGPEETLQGSAADGRDLQPGYAISGKAGIEEREIASLPGYRGMGPVRIGNQAYSQVQHDVYGAAILAAAHVFFDARLALRSDESLFRQLEQLGERAAVLFDQPDAGPWELRGAKRVHTFSSVMCWAGCDRLAKIAARIGLADRARAWRERSDAMHSAICARAWNAKRKSFAATFGGEDLDASLLLLHELNFLRPDDPRFASTVQAIEGELRRGEFLFRYSVPDDFGVPENAFVVCSFWYIDALSALGRK